MNHPECACKKCVAGCKAMPGRLSDADVVALAIHQDVRHCIDDPTALAAAFDGILAASDGALVSKDGVLFRVPSIVPAQHADGHCVFLDEADRCKLHGTDAKPEGCREFNSCWKRTPEMEAKASRLLNELCRALSANGLYFQLWQALKDRGREVEPLHVRRARLAELLGEAER